MSETVPKLRRLPDWESRAVTFLACPVPVFRWGRTDCALWVCDAIKVMTGTDLAAAFRGEYRSEKGAYKALAEIGAGDLENTAANICAENGLAEIEPAKAGRGDPVLLDLQDGEQVRPALGLSWGQHVLAVGHYGLVRLPRTVARRAWWLP